MSFYTEKRNVEAWTHEALVQNEFNKHGFDSSSNAKCVASDPTLRHLFKEDCDFRATSKLSAKEYIVHVKRFDLLNQIPDGIQDPVAWLQSCDISHYSRTNQRAIGEVNSRRIPVDIIWEDKFRPRNLVEWDDEFVEDWYSNRIFAIADERVRYIFIVHGRRVRRYSPVTFWTGPSGNNWNFIPVTEINKVWKDTDQEYVRDTPW